MPEPFNPWVHNTPDNNEPPAPTAPQTPSDLSNTVDQTSDNTTTVGNPSPSDENLVEQETPALLNPTQPSDTPTNASPCAPTPTTPSNETQASETDMRSGALAAEENVNPPASPYAPRVADGGAGLPLGAGAYPSHEGRVPSYAQNVPASSQQSTGAVIALILGIVALLSSWIPFINFISIGLALISLVTAIVVLVRKTSAKTMPIFTVVLCIFSLLVSGTLSTYLLGYTTIADNGAWTISPDDVLKHDESFNEDRDIEADWALSEKLITERLASPNAIQPSPQQSLDESAIPQDSYLRKDAEFSRFASAEGSWKNPAALGREAVGGLCAISIVETTMDATAEYLRNHPDESVAEDQTVIKVTYNYTNMEGHDSEALFAVMPLVDSHGNYHWARYAPGEPGFDESQKLAPNETLKLTHFYVVPKAETYLFYAAVGTLYGFDTLGNASVYFLSLQ